MLQGANEVKKIFDIAIGVVLMGLVIAASMIVWMAVNSKGNEVLDRAAEVSAAVPMERLLEMEMTGKPVLCTLFVSALQDFGETDLLYIHIVDTTPNHYIYTYVGFDLTSVPSGANVVKSAFPVDDAITRLMKYSASKCILTLLKDDMTGMYGVQLVIQ